MYFQGSFCNLICLTVDLYFRYSLLYLFCAQKSNVILFSKRKTSQQSEGKNPTQRIIVSKSDGWMEDMAHCGMDDSCVKCVIVASINWAIQIFRLFRHSIQKKGIYMIIKGVLNSNLMILPHLFFFS